MARRRLFAFVFGGAIPLPGGADYREYLMPGIFAQTVAFASATTAIGMTEEGFPAENPILLTIISVVILIAVFAPLAVWRYRSMSR